MLGERWLRVNEDLPLPEKLAMLKTISDATDARDRCLERLKLDAQPADPWAAAIDASVEQTDGDERKSV